MKLSTLNPLWIERDGARIGVIFDCPHCAELGVMKPERVEVYFVPAHDAASRHWRYAWHTGGSTFDDLTIQPNLSLHHGCWKIKDGEVVDP